MFKGQFWSIPILGALICSTPACKRPADQANHVVSAAASDVSSTDDAFEFEARIIAYQVEMIPNRSLLGPERSFGLADSHPAGVECNPTGPWTYRQKIACTPPPRPDDPHVQEVLQIMTQDHTPPVVAGRLLKQIEGPGSHGAAIAAARVLASPIFDARDLYVDGKKCLRTHDCQGALKDSALLVWDTVATASLATGAGELLTVARAAGKFALRFGKQRAIDIMRKLGRQEIVDFLQRAGHNFFGGLVRHLQKPPQFGAVVPMEGLVDACSQDCVNRTLAFFKKEHFVTLTDQLGSHFQRKSAPEIADLIRRSGLGNGMPTWPQFLGNTPETLAHLLVRGEGFYVTTMVGERGLGHAVATIVRRGSNGLEIITHDAQLGRSYFGLPSASRYQFYAVVP